MFSRMNSQGIRVMLIDDSKVVRHCAQSILTPAGCEVFVSEDGFDALAKIADYRPDFIFLDAIMPRLNGFKTCSLIKSNDQYKHIPVIMLSAKDSVFDRVRSRLAGADAYMTKPFFGQRLLQAIGAHPRQAQRNVAPMELNFVPTANAG